MSVHDRAAGYALGALDGLDRLGYEAHLADCAPCRGDVADAVDAAELLSEGIEVTPPGALRERVLTVVDLAPGAEGAAPAAAQPAADPSGSARRRRWFG